MHATLLGLHAQGTPPNLDHGHAQTRGRTGGARTRLGSLLVLSSAATVCDAAHRADDHCCATGEHLQLTRCALSSSTLLPSTVQWARILAALSVQVAGVYAAMPIDDLQPLTSSASMASATGTCSSSTVYPRDRAIWMTESRVTPGKMVPCARTQQWLGAGMVQHARLTSHNKTARRKTLVQSQREIR